MLEWLDLGCTRMNTTSDENANLSTYLPLIKIDDPKPVMRIPI